MSKKPTTPKEEMCEWTGFHCYEILYTNEADLPTARFFKLVNERKYIVICMNCQKIEGRYSYTGYSPKPIRKERPNADA